VPRPQDASSRRPRAGEPRTGQPRVDLTGEVPTVDDSVLSDDSSNLDRALAQPVAWHAAYRDRAAFSRLTDLLDVAFVGLDAGGTIREANQTAAELLGSTPLDLSGESAFRGEWIANDIHGAPRLPEHTVAARALRDGKVVDGVVSVQRGPERRILAVRGAPDDDDGTLLIATDITEVIAETVGALGADQHLNTAFEQDERAMALVGLDRRFIRTNAAFRSLIRRPEADIVGRVSDDLTPPEDRNISMLPLRRLADGSSTAETFSKRYVCGDGSLVTAQITAVPLANGLGSPTAVFATFDKVEPAAVTGRPAWGRGDRDALLSQVDRWRAEDAETPVTLLVVHLHGLREANASHGHRVGDELLLEATRRLRALAPPRSVVAQLDLEDVALAWQGATVPARRLARRTEASLDTIVDTTVGALQLGYSLGLATARPTEPAASLLADAQLAVGRSMATGPSPLVEYEPALRLAAEEERRLEQELRDAVLRDRVIVHVQPIIDIATGRLVSIEALARIRGVDGRQIMPDMFLDAAERTGLIVPLGDTVLDRACAQLASWRRAGVIDSDVTIKVNVSATQLLRQHAAPQVLATLQRHQLPTTALGLEITEGVLLDLSDRTMRQLAHLVDEGVQLGLDDVGTGWASLSAISRLPLRFLKIDKSFVGGMRAETRHRGDIAVVSALIALGRTAGLDVIAEGVETTEQEEQLVEFGAKLGQGFRYGRPIAMRAFAERFLRRHDREK
jgi:PAS domain S-box-containing protein